MSDRQHIRDDIHDAIQKNAPEDAPDALLKGWVMIAEWVTPENERWLSRVSGDPNGNDCATWQIQGYLHNALHDGDEFE